MADARDQAIDAVAEFATELHRRGFSAESVINALVVCAGTIATREGAEEFMLDLLDTAAESFDSRLG